jgi:hypothetical protein
MSADSLRVAKLSPRAMPGGIDETNRTATDRGRLFGVCDSCGGRRLFAPGLDQLAAARQHQLAGSGCQRHRQSNGGVSAAAFPSAELRRLRDQRQLAHRRQHGRFPGYPVRVVQQPASGEDAGLALRCTSTGRLQRHDAAQCSRRAPPVHDGHWAAIELRGQGRLAIRQRYLPLNEVSQAPGRSKSGRVLHWTRVFIIFLNCGTFRGRLLGGDR